MTEFENDNFMGEIKLNNEEKNYIENWRQKDRKLFLDQKQKNDSGQDKRLLFFNKNAILESVNLYHKKRDLTKAIIMF